MCEQLRKMPKATIAVIEGRVGGGGSELALSCDMRFAGPTAVFNQPEVALGIIPGGSGTVRLPRLIGRSRALEVILGCDDIDAATAERWGWVNRVLPTDELATFVDRLAARIASFPPHAVAAAKASVVRAEAGVVEQLLAEGRRLRRHARRAVGAGGDGALPRAWRADARGRAAPRRARRRAGVARRVMDWVILDVVIGLSFLFFLLSIIAAAMNEAIAGIFRLRARMLEQGIINLINGTPKPQDDADMEIVRQLYAHSLVNGYSRHVEAVVPRLALVPQRRSST